ncbi:MAG: response regulator transcription factor [Pseudomonas sp.]
MSPPLTAPRLLVVDDHRKIRQPLAAYLRHHGCVTDTAEDAAGMWAQLRLHHYDAVILDVMLPDGDGFELCRTLHQRHRLPVILLTARGESEDRVRGLELGADDYVVKPFEPRELLARVRAVLRRQPASPPCVPPRPACYRFAGLRYRPDSGLLELQGAGRCVQLTTAEARLLEVFLAHPRQPLPRATLLGLSARPGDDVQDRAVDRQVSRLRRKLGKDAQAAAVLRTQWGSGYLLATDVQTEPA